MSRNSKFPAMRAVAALVATVIDEAQAKNVVLANTNDPETLDLIERAVDRIERAEADRAKRTPPVLRSRGDRPLTVNERDSIEALIHYQADRTGLSPYTIEKSVCLLFGVECIPQLKAWEYDGVIRYLVDFRQDPQ
jgi:hypothetical protein